MKPFICQVVPPHMLRHLAAQSNDPVAAKAAMQSLLLTERLLGMRLINEKFRPQAEDQMGAEYRQVFDCRNSEFLPGRLIATEGRPPADQEGKEAYDASDATYQLYRRAFGRNSIDGRGMRLINSVHYGQRYQNAFWNGRQMCYGDGDGVIFNRFTIAVDVIGHELTHGVTQFSGPGLMYQDQPGALNESLSDCFGCMVKQMALAQSVDQADWLIGAGLLMPSVKGRALRDMAQPGTAYDDPRLGKDPQPADMDHYVQTTQDNGGVHLNSGIPNRAFYLAACTIGGKSWEGAGQVWYRAQQALTNPATSFSEWAALTVAQASALFGPQHANTLATRQAWEGVKVRPA